MQRIDRRHHADMIPYRERTAAGETSEETPSVAYGVGKRNQLHSKREKPRDIRIYKGQ
jgi:hypothetical protein